MANGTETLGYQILPPFQNVGRFGFFRFIVFAMHLDITYVYIHSKIYESKKVITTYILEQREYNIINMHPKALPIWKQDGSSVANGFRVHFGTPAEQMDSLSFLTKCSHIYSIYSGFAVPDTSVGCNNGRPSAHLLHHHLGIKVKRAKRLPRNNSPGGVYCVAETKDKWFPFWSYRIIWIKLCIEWQQQVAWAASQEGFLMP